LLTNQEPTLYAKWIEDENQTFTITFESNGGNLVDPIEDTAGATISEPTTPTKDGYTFAGWFSDSGLTSEYVFSTMPSEDITLYAKWEAIVVSYTITFESNGGSAVDPITDEADETLPTLPVPTKTDYNFDGWYEEQTLATLFDDTTMPNGPLKHT
jgi:uncharacterized repeat protein (TIGR02543 family)